MKKIGILLLLASLVISCSKNNETETIISSIEFYELVKMSGSFAGSEATGTEMEWQETYTLNTKDSTFTKTRYVNDYILKANGTFSYKTIDNQKYIQLLFNKDTELIGNCYNNLLETLAIIENGTKLISTWSACDGPGLEYNKLVEICGTE